MTGLSTLLVQLEDSAGDFTHDITAYVQMSDGWDFRRGRNDEDGEIEPASLTLTLTNNDSSFTLGSPAFDGITTDKRIRVSETVGGVTYVRFTGYVQDWPVEWTSPMATTAECKVVAIDRQARFNRRNLRSVVENEILLDSPVAYYTLGEPSASTSAGDTSGNGNAPLTPVDALYGTGAPVVFGNAIGPGTDGLTAAEFAGGQYLSAPLVPASTGTVELFITRGATSVGTAESFLDLGALEFTIDYTSGVVLVNTTAGASTTTVTDSEVHHVAITWAAGTASLYVDGALEDTAAYAGTFNLFAVGGTPTPDLGGLTNLSLFYGSLSHVALYDSELSGARIAAHYEAGSDGFETERADERIARLAAYAGVETADMDLETGAQASIAQDVTVSQKVSAAMSSVMEAEGGTLFIAGDGKLTMHNKSRRVLAATSTAALALTTEDIDPGSVVWAADKDYLINTVNVTREGGATQTSVNEASVAQFDEYPEDRTGLLLSNDDLALNVATWLSTAYGDVLPRLASFSLDLLTLDETTVKAALALELGDRVTISGMPTQSPVATGDLIVEGIKEDQSKGAWSLTFNTAPASLFHAWVLEDATYGVLGSTTKLHF